LRRIADPGLQWSRGSVTTETRDPAIETLAAEIASMEPWFGNHGNYETAEGFAALFLLQWSRGSVTTETPESVGCQLVIFAGFNGAVVR